MDQLLNKLDLPKDLKKLSVSELEELAKEVRNKILDVTSKVGGHVASSLGAVELTIAIHACLDSPVDKIVWDVGHQAYAHKILTGRADKFNTLRQMNGLSGFPNRFESKHDPFTVGHSSTSIAQALGLARAREVKKENYKIMAIIGDGALSGGLALEGINNLSQLKSNMIVILNDNEMSISRNVGAFSNYLTSIRTNQFYNKLKGRVERIIARIPRLGVPLVREAKRLKDRTKHFLVDFKFEVIFEEFGIKYFGPIDGHNIPLLMSTIHYAQEINEPVIIHVLTKKGKGYFPAESQATKFHGMAPYIIETGRTVRDKSKAQVKSYSDAFGEAIVKLAEKDESIVAITAAMIEGTGLRNFANQFPKRIFDVGIAEEFAVSFAGGLAAGGLKPVVAIYSTFLQRSFDQLIHDIALQKLPVTFMIDRAGIVGEDGATHNGSFDLAYLSTIPNLIVMSPKDENELKHMFYTAINYKAAPIAIRYPRGAGLGLKNDDEFHKLEIGKAEIVHKSLSGENKLTFFALGSMVYPSVEAAKALEKENLYSTVANMRFCSPIDEEMIKQLMCDTEIVVTLEEGVVSGGFSTKVCEVLEKNNYKGKIIRIGLPNEFIEHGSCLQILNKYGLTTEKIIERILNEVNNAK